MNRKMWIFWVLGSKINLLFNLKPFLLPTTGKKPLLRSPELAAALAFQLCAPESHSLLNVFSSSVHYVMGPQAHTWWQLTSEINIL